MNNLEQNKSLYLSDIDKVKRKRWIGEEVDILTCALQSELPLSQIQIMLPLRTKDGIRRKARKLGFSSSKVADDIIFREGIKRRVRKKKTEVDVSPNINPQPINPYGIIPQFYVIKYYWNQTINFFKRGLDAS